MTTIYECGTLLLGHYSPEERSIPDSPDFDGRNASVVEAMNGALQECYGNGSPWMRWDERGTILHEPTTVTLEVVDGSHEAQITNGWADWMAGCTTVITGHDVDNQLRNDTAATSLKYPYAGTTGGVSGTVYHDCVMLADDVMSLHGIVTVDGREIPPRVNTQLNAINTQDYGFHHEHDYFQGPRGRAIRTANAAGCPLAYALETWSYDPYAPPRLRLRLVPASGTHGVMDYRVMLKPPVIGDIASLDTVPVPQGFVHSVFLPIARQRLMASPFWREQGGGEEIRRAYQEAIDLLQKLHPIKDSGMRLISRF